jgi:hypothetical protein
MYYFRHFLGLVTPSFQPVPLKALNLDVIRNHLFCGLFDLAAAEGVNIWDVANPNFINNLASAKALAKEKGPAFLMAITEEQSLIVEAISKFDEALNSLTSSEFSEIVGLSGPFVDVIRQLLKNRAAANKLQVFIANKKSNAQEINKKYDEITKKKADCYDLLPQLEKYPEIRQLLFDTLSEVGKVFE